MRHQASAMSFSAAFPATAPTCTNRRWRPSAALVPDHAFVTLPFEFRRGPMNSHLLLRALGFGALVLATLSSARAEGTFDIPAGAHFNKEKLAKITEFFNNEVS